MIPKLIPLFLSSIMLGSLGVTINDSIAMEITKKKDEKINFALCLADPKRPLFTKTIDQIMSSKEIRRDFFEYIENDSFNSFFFKDALLGFYKLFKFENHSIIKMNGSLFDIFSNAHHSDLTNPIWAYCLANCLQFGIDTKKDSRKAMELYHIACLGNFSWSLYSLGMIYKNGIGIEKNLNKAIDLLERAAILGNRHAIVRIACIYESGVSIKQNLFKAFAFYKKAAELGDINGISNLALMYEKGMGVDVNLPKAIELYGKAAELGNPYAINNLALMYQDGIGTEQNFQKAIELFQKAIKAGSVGAINNLACMYQHGRGLEKNINTAIELYTKAIKLGNKDAMHALALLYESGKDVEQDFPKAITLFEKAIEAGSTTAINSLAMMYERGRGVKKNIDKAIELYQKAVDLGNLYAMFNLSSIYHEGEGSEKNLDKAIELMEKAFFLKLTEAKKSLPLFLSEHKNDHRLIEIEFNYIDLLPECSIPFIQMLKEKSEMVRCTIESLIQKKYQELFYILLNPKIDHPLKKKLNIAQNHSKKRKRNEIFSFHFQKFSYTETEKDYFRQIPHCILLYMTQYLNPRSLVALASTSRHFHFGLQDRVIQTKIIVEEIHLQKVTFIKKLEKTMEENSDKIMVNIKNITDILSCVSAKMTTKK